MSAPRRRAKLRPAGPKWVDELLAGQQPARGTPAWHEFCAWEFFGREIEGLPPADSLAGAAVLRRCGARTTYTPEQIAYMAEHYPAWRCGDYEAEDRALDDWLKERGR